MEENPDLEDLGVEILQKCGGNPLAISTIARQLIKKETYMEWFEVKNLLWELAEEEDTDILPTLRVSYAHLSSDMQKCFAHCSLFPKGSQIKKATLIQLWMAADFIKSSEKRLPEDIGEEYFKTLLNRNFFGDEEMDAYGNVISCKMHDLMHDLAQNVAGIEYSVGNGDAVDNPQRVIHASVSDLKSIPTSIANTRNLHTFLRTRPYKYLSKEDFDKFTSNFRSLRVLDLGGSFSCQESSNMLNSLQMLTYLRYLDLSNNQIRTLPPSICELQNLQTLKLNYCEDLRELPGGIKSLVSLRHLENYGCKELAGMPSGLGQLTSIQTLPLFVLSSRDELSELHDLNNLRGTLEIKNLEKARNALWTARSACLKEKKYLQTLTLSWGRREGHGDDEDAALLEGLQPNSNIKGLHIDGYGGVTFPKWMFNMRNSVPYLVEMTLQGCPKCVHFSLSSRFRCLKVLKLSSLISLEYIDNYISGASSSKGHIRSETGQWFPSLKEVFLHNLPKLMTWSREEAEVIVGAKGKTEEAEEQQKKFYHSIVLPN